MEFQFNALTPEFYVKDMGRSLSFYIQTLGFKKEYERNNPPFVYLSYFASQIMLQEITPEDFPPGFLIYPFGRGANFQIEVPDLRLIRQRLKSASYPLSWNLEEKHYDIGERQIVVDELQVSDPDGYVLRFSQTIQT